MCSKCSDRTYDKHTRLLPLILYYQTISAEINYNKIKTIGKKISKGSYGKVYMDNRNKELSIKQQLFQKDNPDEVYNDILLIRRCKHRRPKWLYIMITDEEKYCELKIKKAGPSVAVNDFGLILKSEFGRFGFGQIHRKISFKK